MLEFSALVNEANAEPLSDEPSALTESKFRQGLEASLDLPTTDND